MNIGEFIQQAMVFFTALAFVALWGWAIAMLIAGAILVLRSRGSERVFGLFLIGVVLVALPQLIEDYPATLAESSVTSWDKTMPYLAELGERIMNTLTGAFGSTSIAVDTDAPAEPTAVAPTATATAVEPLRPPGPDGLTGGDEETGGGAGLLDTPTPAAPTAFPTITPSPNLTATVKAAETPEPTPTLKPTVTVWPPTPIIMDPAP